MPPPLPRAMGLRRRVFSTCPSICAYFAEPFLDQLAIGAVVYLYGQTMLGRIVWVARSRFNKHRHVLKTPVTIASKSVRSVLFKFFVFFK